MFFRKRQRTDYSVFWFGVIAVLILASIGFAVVFVSGRADVSDITNRKAVQDVARQIIPVPVGSPAIVQERYLEELVALQSLIAEADDAGQLVEDVSSRITAMHVPHQLRDAHFQLFVLVQQQGGDDLEEVQRLLLDAVGALLNQ